ncbi:MAG: DUF3563 domain-containing protein [Hyphomicrobiales bacterium]|nr:MAG: DUF3563 domain-containing protein [Hyphomicrobiales bacterium]
MGFIDSLKSVVRPRSRGDAELDYLNESMSVADLEMRQREIDRGRFRHLPRRG